MKTRASVWSAAASAPLFPLLLLLIALVCSVKLASAAPTPPKPATLLVKPVAAATAPTPPKPATPPVKKPALVSPPGYTNIMLTWSTWTNQLVVQHCTNLTTANWTALTNIYPTWPTNLIVPATNAVEFFRLAILPATNAP